MTYVEFFERHSVENLCACLTHCPDRVIILGDNKRRIERQAERYDQIFKGRGYNVEFICRAINRNSITSIVDTLTEIINTYGDCAFGLTGGEDLCLVAMGVMFERYKDKNLQMHRFNISNNKIYDCDRDGNTIMEDSMPYLTVRENIFAYGGEVVTDPSEVNATVLWDYNEDFLNDIDNMWSICKKDSKRWNIQTGLITAAIKGNLTEMPERKFLDELLKKRLIKSYEFDNGYLSVKYKNSQVKKCIEKSGQALEMKICAEAMRLKDSQGKPLYNDVMNGVFIDWDGVMDSESDDDTENEIDVMMMCGMVPVFVSCKNGRVEDTELYKLNTVATRFGGKYAKKVLVVSNLDKRNTSTKYIKRRAADMGILVVDGLKGMTDEVLRKKISEFWNFTL